MESDSAILQYTPFQSFVHPTFWHKLADIKIDIDKLSDKPKNIHGYYTNVNSKACSLEVDYSSFNSDFKPPIQNFPCYGILFNKNTIEDFKECDKTALLYEEGQKLMNDIRNGNILNDPRLLARFLILSFADLKVHKYYYWFAFPCPSHPIAQHYSDQSTNLKNIPNILAKIGSIYNNFDEKGKSFFILHVKNDDVKSFQLKDLIFLDEPKNNFRDVNLDNYYFCYSDPNSGSSPSWLLRVYISFLFSTCPNICEKSIKFIGIRISDQNSFDDSILWNVKIPKFENPEVKYVGWEPNQNGKMGPRLAAMGETMDPTKLAENSVLLNLKLMKWRLLPDLDLDILSNTKCLLFGAGTLGCAVARNLLAWGFKTISFVDNGKVSYSNPVRQSLYKNEDAVCGNKKKSLIAAERLKDINPNSITKGYDMLIPMPGHTIGETLQEQVLQDLEILENLVQSHDVIYLLTDSRESRWLPTLLGAAHKKIVINAALGFDSYLIMRHGSHKESNKEYKNVGDLKCIPGNELGCYFCNDVTAPGNSLRDRTLDQQCTVTRPGVSNIAASYAVELLVALLQHPDKDLAPAYFSNNLKSNSVIPEGSLGILPHSIRGLLGTFENILPATTKFSQCIACSEKILTEFKNRKTAFLMDAFDSAKYLEDLTGISNFSDLDNGIIECDDWSD